MKPEDRNQCDTIGYVTRIRKFPEGNDIKKVAIDAHIATLSYKSCNVFDGAQFLWIK
jgi:hypothetical protein